MTEPIQLVYVSTAKESGATVHPRNLIIAEANSQVTVLESYVSTGDAAYFTNAVTELVAGDNARGRALKFQDESRGCVSHRGDPRRSSAAPAT